MPGSGEFFGNADQQALTRRGYDLWKLMRDDARVSYYGRSVSLTCFDEGTTPSLAAMCRLQGAASFVYLLKRKEDCVIRQVEAEGLGTDRFATLTGDAACLSRCDEVLERGALPGALSVELVDETTPGDLLAALDRMTSACGVLLLKGSVLRGIDKPAVCLVASDRERRPVAVAASVAINHPAGAQGEDAWWGMLATREDRRGQGISRLLGAMTMREMNRRHGFRRFIAAVREGNTASEQLCYGLGMQPSDYATITAIDPTKMAGGRVTV
ncbi:MAG: GNAT family N-acetyltransferase [Pseudomonadota bacterium]